MSIYETIPSGNSHRHLQLRSPITLEITGELVCANTDDVKKAIAKARVVQPSWAATSMKSRAAIMQKALVLVLKKQDEIIDTVVAETGKARTDAMTMEVFSVADSLCYYAKNAEKFLKPRKRRVHGILGLMKQLRILYKPLGVVGLITPWNAPFVLVMNQAILPGLYYEPTVITDVSNDMDIMVLETFGPVLCIQKVANEGEAIVLANHSEFGLNGNVWTKDKNRGYEVAAAIDTGSCSVNDMVVSYGIPAAPFGGKKNSGVGQVNGKKGMRGYCHEMPIVIDRFGGKMQNAYPYSAKSAEGMRKLMDFLWIKTPLGRWLS